nr:hypothetical protein Itr_chr10CG12070 [Ipomoea trifida]
MGSRLNQLEVFPSRSLHNEFFSFSAYVPTAHIRSLPDLHRHVIATDPGGHRSQQRFTRPLEEVHQPIQASTIRALGLDYQSDISYDCVSHRGIAMNQHSTALEGLWILKHLVVAAKDKESSATSQPTIVGQNSIFIVACLILPDIKKNGFSKDQKINPNHSVQAGPKIVAGKTRIRSRCKPYKSRQF